jgi:hypothetical protein
MKLKTQNLKELYEKDFYLWVMENLKLLKNEEYDLSLEKAWQYAVINLVGWFEETEDLAKKNTLAGFLRRRIFHENVHTPLSR